MDELDIPIFKKTYALYKTFYEYRVHITKQDRYTLWQRCENLILDVLELTILASQRPKIDKFTPLEKASVRLSILRLLLRLAKDTKVIDNKKYLTLESHIDEIGRMLGGWMKAAKAVS